MQQGRRILTISDYDFQDEIIGPLFFYFNHILNISLFQSFFNLSSSFAHEALFLFFKFVKLNL